MSLDRELFGVAARAHLMDVLQTERVNVALPVGDCRIDMLASVESSLRARPARWVPLKVVAECAARLAGNLLAAMPSALLVALIGDIDNPDAVRTFAFARAELAAVKRIALLERETGPGALMSAIEPFATAPGQWRRKLLTILAEDSAAR